MQSKNQDVGFSFTDNRADRKSRWDKYCRIKRHLRGTPFKKVFPIRQDENISDRTNGEKREQPQTEISTTITQRYTADSTYICVDGNGRMDDESTGTITQRYHKGVEHYGSNPFIMSRQPRGGDPKKGGTGALISSEFSYTIDQSPHYVNSIRRLTPTECERLQGYPDNWTKWGVSYPHPVQISDTQRYRCLGNAVTVNVIEAIVKRMGLK